MAQTVESLIINSKIINKCDGESDLVQWTVTEQEMKSVRTSYDAVDHHEDDIWSRIRGRDGT